MKQPTLKTFRMYCTAILVFTFSSPALFAQDLEWARSMGGTGRDAGISIAADAAGNVYTTGTFYDTADLDPGANLHNVISAGFSDVFVSKTNTSGQFVWVKQIGGAGYDNAGAVATDASGNTYVAGTIGDSADIDPGPGTALAGKCIFLVKLDASGNTLWTKAFQSNGYPSVSAMYIDGAGRFYLTGYTTDIVDLDPGHPGGEVYPGTFIARFGSSGTPDWATGFSAISGDLLNNDVTADLNGNVYITGFFTGKIDFMPGPDSLIINSYGMYVMKFSSNGSFRFLKTMPGIAYGRAICTDASGNIFLTGAFKNTVDFDPGSATHNLTASTPSEIFASKLDSSGNFIWASPSPGLGAVDNSGFGISVLPSGNVQVMGYVKDAAGDNAVLSFFDYDAAGISLGSVFGVFGVYWQGSEWNMHTVARNAGDIYVTGSFSGTVGFFHTATLTSAGDRDVFLMKLKGCSLDVSAQPVSQAVGIGSTVQLIAASPQAGVTYQWEKKTAGTFMPLPNFAHYSGTVTNDTLRIIQFDVQDTGEYRCIIMTGNCIVATSAAKLTVQCAFSIHTQPASDTVLAGTDARFIVGATGAGLHYRWQKKAGGSFVNIPDTLPYSGVTNDTFIVHQVTLGQNAEQYRCLVQDSSCTDTSNAVSLTVNQTTGIAEQKSTAHFTVYPNPAHDQLYISTDAAYTGTGYTLTDLAGRKLLEGATGNVQTTVSLVGLAPGIYLLQLQGAVPVRIVKQ